MSDMMFDQRHDARIGFGEATVNTRTSAKPAALRHEPSSRAQLVCQWHRSAQGPLTCTWTEVPSTPPGGSRDLRLPDFAREDHFTCASRPESRLQISLGASDERCARNVHVLRNGTRRPSVMGAVTARRFRDEGAAVVLTGRTREKLTKSSASSIKDAA
jgi:hypothetical protein